MFSFYLSSKMRHLPFMICLLTGLILGSVSMSFALPPCPGDEYNPKTWINCVGTIKDNDTKIVATFRNGRIHGRMQVFNIQLPSGHKYSGGYENRMLNGQGSYSYPNGDTYEGEFSNDKKHGQGTYTYSTGDQYTGEWRNGSEHGQGTIIHADGSKYSGDWKDGITHGTGTFSQADGTQYTGDFKNGLPDGLGTVKFSDGSSYVGAFKEFLPHGEGTFIDIDQSVYIGEYKNGEKHGQGTLKFAEGDQYSGNFTDGSIDGMGAFIFVNGDYVSGNIRVGKFGKNATYIFANGDQYVGEVDGLVFDGNGALDLISGDTYVGEFKDGNIHGKGTYTYFKRGQYVGEFKDGNIHGKGTLTGLKGDKYNGEFKNNDVIGNGSFILNNGDTVDGFWETGAFQSLGVRISIKNAFKNESELNRKKIQYALKKLVYYNSSIDALYGPGTEKALVNYAKDKNLNKKYPYNIFSSLLKKVSTPTSFPTTSDSSIKSNSPASSGLLNSGRTSSFSTSLVANLFKGLIVAGVCSNTKSPAACIAGATGSGTKSYDFSSNNISTSIPGYSNLVKKVCSFDKDCGFRGKCAKRLGKRMCVTAVDQSGRKSRNRDFELLGCRRNSDCPSRFSCNRSMRICLKN